MTAKKSPLQGCCRGRAGRSGWQDVVLFHTILVSAPWFVSVISKGIPIFFYLNFYQYNNIFFCLC